MDNPFTKGLITDTHYDNPDRRGRQVAFIARLMTDYDETFYGIGIEEYTAVCIDELNMAHVFGHYPGDDDFAYFIQVNCFEPSVPEECADGDLLTWDRNDVALKVIKMAGTNTGSGFVDLNDWKTAGGADFTWENWWVENAIFKNTEAASPINCDSVLQIDQIELFEINLMVNQDQQLLIIQTEILFENYVIRDITGKLIEENIFESKMIPIQNLINGNYLFTAIDVNGNMYTGIFTK